MPSPHKNQRSLPYNFVQLSGGYSTPIREFRPLATNRSELEQAFFIRTFVPDGYHLKALPAPSLLQAATGKPPTWRFGSDLYLSRVVLHRQNY